MRSPYLKGARKGWESRAADNEACLLGMLGEDEGRGGKSGV